MLDVLTFTLLSSAGRTGVATNLTQIIRNGLRKVPMDCWVFFRTVLAFLLQAAFVKSRSSRSISFGVRYPRAE